MMKILAADENMITEEDVLNSIDYIKQYWRDPTHWSTPHGMINLSIIFQVIFGMWFFHNTFWHMYDVPSWSTSIMMAFVVVKFPFYAAFVINKQATPFMYGTLVGSSAMMTLNSFLTALFWARSSSCHGTKTEALLTTRHCSETLISSMKTEFHLSVVIFALQLHFLYLVMSREIVNTEAARSRVVGKSSCKVHIYANVCILQALLTSKHFYFSNSTDNVPAYYSGVRQHTDEDFEFKQPTNYGLEQFGTRSHDDSSIRLIPGPSMQHTPL